MKKLLLLLFIFSLTSYSQKISYEGNTAIVVFQLDSLSADEIHSRALSAIANIFNSANDVIQLNDKASKKIVVRGKASVEITNPIKSAYPNTKFIDDIRPIYFDTKVNIDSKDNRYRIEYEVMNPEYQYGNDREPFGFFSFDFPNEKEKISYVEKMMDVKGINIYVGKKKRDIYKAALIKVPNEVTEVLRRHSDLFFYSIQTEMLGLSKNSTDGDDW